MMTRLIDLYHWLYPFLGALWYRFPGRHLTVIGVTGTDGKSSTVVMLAHVLNAAGYRTGHFSSISYGDGGNIKLNEKKMTTPGRFYAQRFLRELVNKGCTHAVLEITSEGIKQYRHSFIGFDRVVFTNITAEHIERHRGFENYRDTKLSLIKSLKEKRLPGPAVIANGDDPVLSDCLKTDELKDKGIDLLRVSMRSDGPEADVRGRVEKNDLQSAVIEATSNSRSGETRNKIELKMGGPFVAINAVMAFAVAGTLRVSSEVSARALSAMGPLPGRFEVVSAKPVVIVDYGHTVAALEGLLPYLRAHTKGRLIHVFGAAGGGRDRWKRKKMAALSEKYADLCFLTEENPFDEDPESITKDIREGFSDIAKVRCVPVREHAIQAALKEAHSDDTVLLSAKGSETVIAGPRGSLRPYNERKYVSKLLSESVPSSGDDSV